MPTSLAYFFNSNDFFSFNYGNDSRVGFLGPFVVKWIIVEEFRSIVLIISSSSGIQRDGKNALRTFPLRDS